MLQGDEPVAGVCGVALKKAQAEEERLKSELETMDVGDLDASFLSDDDDTAGEQAGNTVQEDDDTHSNSTHTSHSTHTPLSSQVTFFLTAGDAMPKYTAASPDEPARAQAGADQWRTCVLCAMADARHSAWSRVCRLCACL